MVYFVFNPQVEKKIEVLLIYAENFAMSQSPAGTALYNRRFLHSVPIGTVVTRLGMRFLPTFRPYRDGLPRWLSEL
jgi:hypothetical protein